MLKCNLPASMDERRAIVEGLGAEDLRTMKELFLKDVDASVANFYQRRLSDERLPTMFVLWAYEKIQLLIGAVTPESEFFARAIPN